MFHDNNNLRPPPSSHLPVFDVFKSIDGRKVRVGQTRAINPTQASTRAVMVFGNGAWAEHREFA